MLKRIEFKADRFKKEEDYNVIELQKIQLYCAVTISLWIL